jgi:hypothetical protein
VKCKASGTSHDGTTYTSKAACETEECYSRNLLAHKTRACSKARHGRRDEGPGGRAMQRSWRRRRGGARGHDTRVAAAGMGDGDDGEEQGRAVLDSRRGRWQRGRGREVAEGEASIGDGTRRGATSSVERAARGRLLCAVGEENIRREG